MATEQPDEAGATASLIAARAALARGEAGAARAAARAARLALLPGEAGAAGRAEAWTIEAVASNILLDHPAALECAMEAEALLPPDDVRLRLRALNVRFLIHAESGNLAGALDCSRPTTASCSCTWVSLRRRKSACVTR
jgi:hypothetical protein